MYAYVTVSTERAEINKNLYKILLDILRKYDFENTNDYLNLIVNSDKKVPSQGGKDFYRKTFKKIKKATLMIADISDPSVTLGALVEYAKNNNIQVLCICDIEREDNIPTLFRYFESSLFSLVLYKRERIDKDLEVVLSKFKKPKIKFNAHIEAELDNYLTWYALRNGMSKSNLFRSMIREKMDVDEDYKKETMDGE